MSLEFTEYTYPRSVYGAMPQMPRGSELATQVVAIAASSTLSAAFQASTQLIVITKVDVDCRIAIGASPTAAATTRFLRAGSEYAFTVDAGQKLAVIAA